MERALPVAVKFLHKGNKEMSRNMASYLSLAAIDHASLLSPHVQPIMDSIISGIHLDKFVSLVSVIKTISSENLPFDYKRKLIFCLSKKTNKKMFYFSFNICSVLC